MSFNFGSTSNTNAAPSTGFSFGSSTTAPTSATNVPASGTSFSFGGATSAPAPSGGFSFGGAPATTSNDTKAPSTSAGFSFGGSSASAPATNSNPSAGSAPAPFSFGGAASAPAPFSFGGAAPAPSADKPAGGFSFGGASSTDTKVPAPSTTAGFSFGGTTAAPAAADSKSSAGFNFGGTAAPDATKTSNPDAETKQEEPKAPSFSFSTPAMAKTPAPKDASSNTNQPAASSTQPAASTTQPSTTAPTASSIQVQPPPPIEYQTRNISEIINSFSKALEEDALTFLSEAKRIAEYDLLLRTSETSITSLMDQISKVMYYQSELDRSLKSVNSYHSSMNNMLTDLEKQVDDLFTAQLPHVTPQEADLQREKMYQTALELNSNLEHMQGRMEDDIRAYNLHQENIPKNDLVLDNMVQVLNSHYEHLNKLQNVCGNLQADVDSVEKSLNTYLE